MAKIRYNNVDNVSTDKTLKEFRQWREERRRKKKDYTYKVPNHPPQVSYLAGSQAGDHNHLDRALDFFSAI